MIDIKNLIELKDKLLTHKGRMIESKIDSLKDSVAVLAFNFNNLNNFITEFKQNPKIYNIFFDEDYSKEREQFKIQCSAYILNFLSSASNWFEHTRKITEDLLVNTPFIKTYNDLKEKAFNNTDTFFIKDLRNYLFHFKLPFIGYQLDIKSKDDVTNNIFLDKKELLKYKNWKRESKMFLNSCKSDNINFFSICDRYYYRVTRFISEYIPLLEEQFKNELLDYKKEYENYKKQSKELRLFFDSVNENVNEHKNISK